MLQQPSGYRTSFCNQCGSPLPKIQPNGKLYWIPAGLIDGGEQADLDIALHIYVDSKAPWDDLGGDAIQHPEDWPDRR